MGLTWPRVSARESWEATSRLRVASLSNESVLQMTLPCGRVRVRFTTSSPGLFPGDEIERFNKKDVAHLTIPLR